MASTRHNGFIGGGNGNYIDTTGTGAAATTFGVRGGGQNNLLIHDYAAVFGSGITSVAPGTVHINHLWIATASCCQYNSIAAGVTFASGTVYVDTSIGAGKPLRMQ